MEIALPNRTTCRLCERVRCKRSLHCCILNILRTNDYCCASCQYGHDSLFDRSCCISNHFVLTLVLGSSTLLRHHTQPWLNNEYYHALGIFGLEPSSNLYARNIHFRLGVDAWHSGHKCPDGALPYHINCSILL